MSKWREIYKVHPAADVFPMMSDDELAKLGEDIKTNGLNVPLSFCWVETGTPAAHRVLIDGRNRLEAMERVGIRLCVRGNGLPERLRGKETANIIDGDPVAHIISLNIHRRHLTKEQQADLIVAVHKATANPSSKWRGVSADPVKAAAVTTAKEHGISKRTVERSFAKAEGKKPKPAKPRKTLAAHPADPDYMRLLKAFQELPVATRQRFLEAHTKPAEIKNGTAARAVDVQKVKAVATEITTILAKLSEADQKTLIERLTPVAPDLAWQLRLLLAENGDPWCDHGDQ